MKKLKSLILTMLAVIAGGCEKSPQTVPVAGVKLDKYAILITEGDKSTLSATVLPSNASNKDVSWASSAACPVVLPTRLTCSHL